MPDPSPSKLTVLNSNFLQLGRKSGGRVVTAGSLPQAVYLTTVKHTALVGIEPTTFRSWVQRATSCSYKNLHHANSVVSQYLNTYRTFTSNTGWNMTHNQTKSSHIHVESSIGGKIMQNLFSRSGGMSPCPPCDRRSWCSAGVVRFSIGSWAYDGNTVRLQVAEGTAPLDLSFYSSGCPLVVESHTASVANHTYPCCEETYPSMDVDLTLKLRQ